MARIESGSLHVRVLEKTPGGFTNRKNAIEIQKPTTNQRKNESPYSVASISNATIGTDGKIAPIYRRKEKRGLAAAEVALEQYVWGNLEAENHLTTLNEKGLAMDIHAPVAKNGKETRTEWQKFNDGGLGKPSATDRFLVDVNERTAGLMKNPNAHLQNNLVESDNGDIYYRREVGGAVVAGTGHGMETTDQNLAGLKKFYEARGIEIDPRTGIPIAENALTQAGLKKSVTLKPTTEGKKYMEVEANHKASVSERNKAQAELKNFQKTYEANKKLLEDKTKSVEEHEKLTEQNRLIETQIASKKDVVELYKEQIEKHGSEMEKIRESIMGISTSAPSQRQPAPPVTPNPANPTNPATNGNQATQTAKEALKAKIKADHNIDLNDDSIVVRTLPDGTKIEKKFKNLTDEDFATGAIPYTVLTKVKNNSEEDKNIISSWDAWTRGVNEEGKVIGKDESSTGWAKARSIATLFTGAAFIKTIWSWLFPAPETAEGFQRKLLMAQAGARGGAV